MYMCLIYTRILFNFAHVGLGFYFHVRKWRDVVWSVWMRNLIAIVYRHLSEAVHGSLWFVNEYF